MTDIVQTVEGEHAPAVRAKPGRRPLPEGEKIPYHDERISMRTAYWDNLQRAAELLAVFSLSGKNRGKPSWRAMIRFLSEQIDWIVLAVQLIRNLDQESRAILWTQYTWEQQALKEIAELREKPEWTSDDDKQMTLLGQNLWEVRHSIRVRVDRIHRLPPVAPPTEL